MSAWAWLVVCWAGVLGGFVLGARWMYQRYHDDAAAYEDEATLLKAEVNRLEDEAEALRQARKAEWERKIDAGGTP